MKRFEKAEIAEVFDSYPQKVRKKLLFLRKLIFDVASTTEGVGPLEEALKWGQPSYLTSKSKSGSTIRIDQIRSREGSYAMYFHCQTTLVETFREIHGDVFKYEGNRSIVFDENDEIPTPELNHCVSLALTYHLNKRTRKRR